jgi:hypothetical protein
MRQSSKPCSDNQGFSNSNSSENMSRQAIVRTIANLEATNIPLANQFISLNQWNY